MILNSSLRRFSEYIQCFLGFILKLSHLGGKGKVGTRCEIYLQCDSPETVLLVMLCWHK